MPDDGSFNLTDEQRRRGRGSGGVTGRGFRPGASGCPGGRPRQDVTALARAHTVDAIEALVAALKRPKEAVPAAIALLNRGWGAPTTTVNTNGETSLVLLHLAAAQALSRELQAELGGRPVTAPPEPQLQPLTIDEIARLPPPSE